MTKITISTIRRALNECDPIVGEHIERAVYQGDSFWLMDLIEEAIKDLGKTEATSGETV